MRQSGATLIRILNILGLVSLTALTPQSANADFRSTFGQLLNPPSPNPPPAVARIYAKESGALASGSGSLIYVDEQFGYVLTNWHVVRDAENGQVMTRFPNGFESAATILKMDSKWDLALLRIWKPNVTPLPLSKTVPVLGERLTIMGYGSGKFRAAHGACKYYASPDNQSPSEMIEISAAARQGDSGGPMMNERGELAAVLFGSGRGVTTGTHVGRVVEFLNSIDYTVEGATDANPSEDSTNGNGKDLVADRVVDEEKSQLASLVVQPQQSPARNASQYYQLPPLEWSTIDDNSEVVTAAAQLVAEPVSADGQLVAQNPQPRVANQIRPGTRLSLTIEPFEPESDADRVPKLEIELPEPAAMPFAAEQPRSQPQRITPQPLHQQQPSHQLGSQPQQNSFNPFVNHTTIVDRIGTSMHDASQVPNNTTRTSVANPFDPLAAQTSTQLIARTGSQHPPAGYRQPQFSAYGTQSFNASFSGGYGSINPYAQNSNAQMPRMNLRKLLSIAQSILAVVGVVTLLERFRRS